MYRRMYDADIFRGFSPGCWLGLLGERNSATKKIGALQTRQSQLQRTARSSTRRLLLPSTSTTKLQISCWETFGYGKLAARVRVHRSEAVIKARKGVALECAHGRNASYHHWRDRSTEAGGCVLLYLLAVHAQTGPGRGADAPVGYAISSAWVHLSFCECWMRNILRRKHQLRTLPASFVQLTGLVAAALRDLVLDFWSWSKREGVALLKIAFKVACLILLAALALVYAGTVYEYTVSAGEYMTRGAHAVYEFLPANPTAEYVDNMVAVIEQGQTNLLMWVSPHLWHMWALMLLVRPTIWAWGLWGDLLNRVWERNPISVGDSLLVLAHLMAYPIVYVGHPVKAVAIPTINWILRGWFSSATATTSSNSYSSANFVFVLFSVLLSNDYLHPITFLLVFASYVVEKGTSELLTMFGWDVFEVLITTAFAFVVISIFFFTLSFVPLGINWCLDKVERKQKAQAKARARANDKGLKGAQQKEAQKRVGISGQTLRGLSHLCRVVSKFSGVASAVLLACLVVSMYGFELSNGGLPIVVPRLVFVMAVLDVLIAVLLVQLLRAIGLTETQPGRYLPTMTIFALYSLTLLCCPYVPVKSRQLGFWEQHTCWLGEDEASASLTRRFIRFWLDLFGQLASTLAVAFALALVLIPLWRIYKSGGLWRHPWAKTATQAERSKARNRKAAQKQHTPRQPAAQTSAIRPTAELGMSADPLTTGAIVLHASARVGITDRRPPSKLRRPTCAVLPSALASSKGKIAVLVTWPEATDSHRVSTETFLCTMVGNGGQERPVYAGDTHGCEVHVDPGVAVGFFVQARNSAGLSPPSTKVELRVPQQAPQLRASSAAASSSRAPLEPPPPASATKTQLEDHRRAEAKQRLSEAMGSMNVPSDAAVEYLKLAIRAAHVAQVNHNILDRARAKLQDANNARQRRGVMVDKLRRLLAKGVTQSQADAIEKLITLAEQTGVTDDENDQLLSHLRKRVADARVPPSSASTIASAAVRATESVREETAAQLAAKQREALEQEQLERAMAASLETAEIEQQQRRAHYESFSPTNVQSRPPPLPPPPLRPTTEAASRAATSTASAQEQTAQAAAAADEAAAAATDAAPSAVAVAPAAVATNAPAEASLQAQAEQVVADLREGQLEHALREAVLRAVKVDSSCQAFPEQVDADVVAELQDALFAGRERLKDLRQVSTPRGGGRGGRGGRGGGRGGRSVAPAQVQQPDAAQVQQPVAGAAASSRPAAETDEPPDFMCSMTLQMMEDPVIAMDGHTYERVWIEAWLENHDTSPLTNLPLPSTVVVPNHNLRAQLYQWRQRQRHAARG